MSDQLLPTVDVMGTPMAFRAMGDRCKPTVLFLHGNPTSSYIWRNIMPVVANAAYCVAPDLVGFGQSGKPDIEYRFVEHVAYLDQFLVEMGIESAYLVAQDWGTAFAFELAARRPGFVRGLAFMEFIRPMRSWDEFHQTPRARELFRQFRTPELGEALVLRDNVFVEKVLPGSIHRKLDVEEMQVYRQPFMDERSRIPTLRFPRELPVEGQPADVHDLLAQAHQALRASTYPKLLFVGNPGALVSPGFAQEFAAGLHDCRLVELGDGAHYLQEDHPQAIGEGVLDLVLRTEQRRDGAIAA